MKTQKNILLIVTLIILTACNPQDNKKKHKNSQEKGIEWIKNATIYEVNIRQYTPEGTFEAFEKHLPRLQKLGVKVLWLMPIHPISEKNRKGTLGSYYAVQDYKAVNPEFGTLDNFKNLVNKAHEMGFKVIIDWVANHTGWDNVWISNKDWYTKDSLGNMQPPVADWTDVADLNYENPEMRAAMIDALQYWIKETNIDGYRCDIAGLVPVDFWQAARDSLEKIKPIFMLAEDEENSELLSAFDANYGWEFHHIMNDVAKGEKSVDDIKRYLKKAQKIYPKSTFPMQFITNHDENSWNGTINERLVKAQDALTVLYFTVPGMPLIYSGQEAGLSKRLKFFDKDEIDWENLEENPLYKKLIMLKKEHPALWHGKNESKIKFIATKSQDLLVYKRTKGKNEVTIYLNLSDTLVTKNINGKNICLKNWGYKIEIQ